MKRIMIDYNKCTGCRHCEAACSLKHYENIVSPQKSRIRVFLDEEKDLFFPVVAGPFSEAGCPYRTMEVFVNIGGKEYDACSICRASCPRRPWFRELDIETALTCNFCGDPPDPHCVKICVSGALTLIEVENSMDIPA